jgi:uncharacterized protein (DUF3820 family)
MLAALDQLRRKNAELATDNMRLRERLSAQRKALPPGVMNFGKYQGTPVTEVPTSYLEWCIDKCFSPADMTRKATRALADAIREELRHRWETVDNHEPQENHNRACL